MTGHQIDVMFLSYYPRGVTLGVEGAGRDAHLFSLVAPQAVPLRIRAEHDGTQANWVDSGLRKPILANVVQVNLYGIHVGLDSAQVGSQAGYDRRNNTVHVVHIRLKTT